MRVHRNCCGLDVHKKIIAACLIREDSEGNSVPEKRLFGSMTRDLHELAQWLCAAQVTAVAMFLANNCCTTRRICLPACWGWKPVWGRTFWAEHCASRGTRCA